MHQSTDVIENVRRALGRSAPLTTPPVPPAIDETITRLVHTDIGLPELFAKTAIKNKMTLTSVTADELTPKLIAYLTQAKLQKIALPGSLYRFLTL